jgi:hypothetical protein
MKSASKRTAQWMGAVLILAVMVFGLAFAMNYLDQGPSRPVPKKSAGPRLEFTTPLVPTRDNLPLLCEPRQQGYHDYWFRNPSDNDLTVGLRSVSSMDFRGKVSDVNSKGLRVELYRVPEQSLPDLPPEPKQEAIARELGEKLEGRSLAIEEGLTVPGRAIGWLRLHWDAEQLHWDAERPEPRRLDVVLWMGHPQDNQPTQLAANLLIVRPLLVEKEVSLGTMEARSLPRSCPVYCGSATRSDLRVEAEVEHHGRPGPADPLEIESVERLSDAERRERAKSADGPMYHRCAYRVTVKLRDVSADGTTPFEWGPFQRSLRLKCAGTDVAQQVVLRGTVQGDVVVGAPNTGGGLDIQGGTGAVLLQSDVPGLELEVDAARTPEYLEVPPLKEPEVASSGHRTWRLVVKVRPNKVSGPLPGDCAVYVKRKGGAPRTIRVPVVGLSNSG